MKFRLFLFSFLLIALSRSQGISQTIDLQFSPETATVAIGSTVSIQLNTSTLNNLLAMQVDIAWDATKLELQQPLADINPLFSAPNIPLDVNYNTSGTVATQWVSPTNTLPLTGTMYTLNFTVLAEGTSTIEILHTGQSPIFVADQGNIEVTTNTATIIAGPNNGNLTLNCSEPIEVTTAFNENTAQVSWDTPIATTTCPSSPNTTITQSNGQPSGSFFSIGQHVISYQATDDCDNSTNCSFTVDVIQGTNSGSITIQCNNNDTITTTVGETSAQAFWQTPIAATTCPLSTIVNITQTTGQPSGTVFEVGTHIITYTVVDSCGNTETCTFSITIVEGVNLGKITLDCPENINITLAPNQTTTPVSWQQPTPMTTCSINSAVELIQTTGQASGSSFAVGTYPITYVASDECDNSLSCYFVVTINESTNTSCPSSIAGFSKIGEFQGHGYYKSNNEMTWLSAQTLAESNDGYLVSITSLEENNYLQNEVDGMFFIGLSDHQSEGNLTWQSGEDISFTNYANCSWCGTNNESNDFAVFLPWDGTWAFDNIWVNRKMLLERVCGTNPSSQITLSCSDNITQTLAQNQTTTTVTWSAPIATTTCTDNNITLTQTNGLTSGSAFPQGTHTISYTATDNCGNTETCSFVITVNAAPSAEITLNCPSNITQTLTEGQSTITVTWSNPIATTTCTNNNITLTQTNGLTSGSEFPQGVHTVTYIASDNCQNTETCSFSITINEFMGGTDCPPTITGFDKIGDFEGHSYFLSESVMTWTQAKAVAGASNGYIVSINSEAENQFLKDNLPEMAFIGLSDDQSEGDLVWENGENLSYTNYSSCSWCGSNTDENDFGVFLHWDGTWAFDNQWVNRKFILEVNCGQTNNGYLSLFCPANISATLPQGQTQSMQSWDAPTSFSTCPLGSQITVNQTVGQTSGSLFSIGTHTVGYEATDACDNTANCSFTVTIAGQPTECGPIAGYTLLAQNNGHAYYLSENIANWNTANTESQSHGGYLLAINDQAENDLIKSMLNNTMAFIGLNDAESEGTNTWTNGQAVTFDLSYDNNAENDYAVMNFWAGTWGMVNQWVHKNYIMEKSCSSGKPTDFSLAANNQALSIATISPNPATQDIRLTIEMTLDAEVDIQIFTPSGQQVYTTNQPFVKGFNQLDISITQLNSGLYFVRLIGESTNQVLKFVKN